MSALKRRLLLAVALIVGAVACGVGGAAIASVLSGCGPSTGKPAVAPNSNGADCLAERQKGQLDCVQRFATRPEIEKCIADGIASKKIPECATEAGVEAYVTSRDAGGDQ